MSESAGLGKVKKKPANFVTAAVSCVVSFFFSGMFVMAAFLEQTLHLLGPTH